MTEPICEVIITADSEDWLVSFTRSLVEDRLVACGQHIAPIRSIYRWEGTVHDDSEMRVALHTRTSLVDRVIDHPRAHPYEVPRPRLPNSGWEPGTSSGSSRRPPSQVVIIGPDDSFFDACQEVLSENAFPWRIGRASRRRRSVLRPHVSDQHRSATMGSSAMERSPHSYRQTARWNGCAFPALTLPASSDGSLVGTPACSVLPLSMLPCPPMSVTCQAP